MSTWLYRGLGIAAICLGLIFLRFLFFDLSATNKPNQDAKVKQAQSSENQSVPQQEFKVIKEARQYSETVMDTVGNGEDAR